MKQKAACVLLLVWSLRATAGESLQELLLRSSERFDCYRAAFLLEGKKGLSEDLLKYLEKLSTAVAQRSEVRNPQSYLARAYDYVFGEEGFRLLEGLLSAERLYFRRVVTAREGPEVALALILRASVRNCAFPVEIHYSGGYSLVSGPAGARAALSVRTGEVHVGGAQTASSVLLSPRALVGRYALLLGKASRQAGNTAEARRLLRIAWRLDPRQQEVYGELGQIALRQWELARAERLLSRALRLAPTLRSALLGRAELLIRRGEVRSAQVLLEKILAQKRNDFHAHLLRGELFVEREEYSAAFEEFSLLCAHHAQEARVWIGLGLAYLLGRRDRTKALECLQRAEQLGSSSAYLHYAFGRYFSESDPAEAFTAYRRALQANVRFAPVYYFRGRLYQERGLAEAALSDYQTFVSLLPEHRYAQDARQRIEALKADLAQ